MDSWMGLVYKGRWGTHAQTNESFYTEENEKNLWQQFALQKREEIQVEKNCRTQHVPPNFALSRIQIPFVAEKRRGNEFPQREVAPLSVRSECLENNVEDDSKLANINPSF